MHAIVHFMITDTDTNISVGYICSEPDLVLLYACFVMHDAMQLDFDVQNFYIASLYFS
jgi:hypothetical protein